jgi:hypothetical protein
MNPIRRHRDPREDPRGNLVHVAQERHYRIEMTDGEVLRGVLLEVAPDGSSAIRLDDGAVITRRCERMLRITEVDRGGPPAERPMA